MNAATGSIHHDRFVEIGEFLIKHAELIVQDWSRRAPERLDETSPAHREDLRKTLPEVLRWIGTILQGKDPLDPPVPQRQVSQHGQPRWVHGWQLADVVSDYHLLRITILEYLDNQLEQHLTLREVLAIGQLLDNAVTAAVEIYVAHQESHLAESESRFRINFENAAVGIAHVRMNGEWVRANQRLCEILGYSSGQLMETNLFSVTCSKDRADLRTLLEELSNGRSVSSTQELRLLSRHGREVWVQLTGSALTNGHGRVQYLILIVEDISVRKQLDQELNKARQAAEAANDAKSRFVANVSHEIRTPMTAILGLTELALDESLSPLVRDYLSTVLDSTKSVLGLLNDLLDLSKIEANRLALELATFDLHQTVQDSLRQHLIRANAKGLDLKSEIHASVPQYVKGDALRVRQVLSNLCSNAVKFTEGGQVIVRVNSQQKRDDRITIQFEVIDTGVGISKADQETIFAPFTQGSSTPRSLGGSGLGLAIVSELVRRMHGRLWVVSKLGHGSAFNFTAEFVPVPLGDRGVPPDIKTSNQPLQPPDCALNILVVEDVPASQKVIRAMLSKRGHRLVMAANGREALQKIGEERFDVVLMDVEMPFMDGYEATLRIRRMADPMRSGTPVVAMTAHAMRGDAEKCYASGMDAFLAKPIDSRELIHVLEGVAKGTPSHRRSVGLENPIPEPQDSNLPGTLNLDAAIGRLGGHVSLLRDLIEFFVVDGPELVVLLKAALAAKELDQARRACHSLRGLAANFDATECMEAAKRLEDQILKEDWNYCEAELPALELIVDELVGSLKDWREPNIGDGAGSSSLDTSSARRSFGDQSDR